MMIRVCTGILIFALVCQADNQLCTREYLTYEEIRNLSTGCTAQTCELPGSLRGYTIFFDIFTFTCNGILANWTLSGDLVLGEVRTNPTFIFWRANPRNPMEYEILQESVPLLQCNGRPLTRNSEQIYKCELQHGPKIQKGDVLGMNLPSYDDHSDTFHPYFEVDVPNLPTVHFRRGTAVTTYVLSGDDRTRSARPLLSVDVVDDDPDSNQGTQDSTTSDIMNVSTLTMEMPNKTDESRADGRNIVIGINDIIGIAVGIFILLAVFVLLVGIQCYIILRNTRRSKEIYLKYKRCSEYMSQPYATIEVSGINMNKANVPTANYTSQKDILETSNNASYGVLTPQPDTSNIGNRCSIYTNAEDITLLDGPGTGSLPLLKPDQSDHGIPLSIDNKEVHYASAEELHDMDEMTNSKTQLQPDSFRNANKNKDEDEDKEECLYY